MRTFKTTDGAEWVIDLNIETARRLRAAMREDENLQNVDFLDYAALLTSLNDVFFAADLVYFVCKDQADERNVTAADFGRLLKGSLLFDAITAFTGEYLDFFPDPTIAEKMRALVEKTKNLKETVCDALMEKADELAAKTLEDVATRFGTLSLEQSPLPAETTLQSKN